MELQQQIKYCGKEEKLLLISPLFHNIFNISVTSGGKLHIHLLNVVVRFIVFFYSTALIYQGMDILKCFKETLGIRDNESRLYMSKNLNKSILLPTGIFKNCWISGIPCRL